MMRRRKPKHIKDLDYWDLRGIYTRAINHLVHAETDLNGIIGHLDMGRRDRANGTGT